MTLAGSHDDRTALLCRYLRGDLDELVDLSYAAERLGIPWPRIADLAHVITATVRRSRPKSQGSHKGVADRRTGRVVFKDGTPHGWRDVVTAAAMRAAPDIRQWDGPAFVVARYRFTRPASARPDRVPWPATGSTPDVDKLDRAIGDALQARLLANDSRIVAWLTGKTYVDTVADEGVDLTVLLARPDPDQRRHKER